MVNTLTLREMVAVLKLRGYSPRDIKTAVLYYHYLRQPR